ncbi:MAG: uroporphyrinogen-III synthase [Betaproteobacteria bacterium]|nr:uroporphyrinogen-III synthase [Betaproteobacteria bacterium]
MVSRVPLRRPGLLITRPRVLGEELAARIAQEGGQAWLFPTLEIRPLPLRAEQAKAVLQPADWIIFISANAVSFGWPWVIQSAPVRGRLAAVGQATAERLEKQSRLPVLYPTQGADSEALLSMPEFAAIAGQTMAIVRGRGGREWLKSTLESRGAHVNYLECYERCLPNPDLGDLDDALAQGAAISVQSAEALKNLWTLAGETRHGVLQQRDFLVSHPKIAAAAQSLGIRRVHVTEPGEAALVAYWKTLTTLLPS